MGLWIGVVLAVLHLCLVILAYSAMMRSRSSTAALAFVPFTILDAPLLLVPPSVFHCFGRAAPLIQFGIFGSAMWFLIPWMIDLTVRRIFPRGIRTVRVIVIVGAIPCVLFGFQQLGFFAVKHRIRQKRPEELKNVLNQASSDFLTEKVVFEDSKRGHVTSITRMPCRPGAGTETLVALSWGIAFLDENYQERHGLDLSAQRFLTIEPLAADDADSCRFLAYKLHKGVYLYDLEGHEIWKFIRLGDKDPPIAGVRHGDVDGDGKPEFAILHNYKKGIQLIDEDSQMLWKHSVLSLGCLVITDIDNDGKAEVIYTNANNAGQFTFLDATGAVTNQLQIRTESSEFAIIRWPQREAKPNILLTEEGKIRIVDLKGETVLQLDAPGCRTFGKLKAVTVKFNKDKPEYLAVRKRLFPDISVLYVYDNDGKLVYQKTEVIRYVPAPTLLVVPAKEADAENLLVGSVRNDRALILEYSLTQ